MKKSVCVLAGLFWWGVSAFAGGLPKMIIEAENQGDVRFAPYLGRFCDVAAQQLATQFTCVRRQKSGTPLQTNQVVQILGEQGADGLCLMRIRSLTLSDGANSIFEARGTTRSRLYTFRGSYVVFNRVGCVVAEGALRATHMTFDLTGLNSMEDGFIQHMFTRAVSEMVRDLSGRQLDFSHTPFDLSESAPTNATAMASALIPCASVAARVPSNGVSVATNRAYASVSVQIPQTNRAGVVRAQTGGLLTGVTNHPAVLPIPVPIVTVSDRAFVDIPDISLDVVPTPREVAPVMLTLVCTPCNPTEQAIFLPDIRLEEHNRAMKLTTLLPIQVACAVEVDGVIVGVAPVHIALMPGEHRIRFEHDGFMKYESMVHVNEPGQLVFPLRMTQQGFRRWALSSRVLNAIESGSLLGDDDIQMLQREIRRLHSTGIRLDASRLEATTLEKSIYRLATQK